MSMNMRGLKQAIILSTLSLAFLGFQNCSKTSFKTSEPSTNKAQGSCAKELTNITVPVKILFVVDTSSSNNSTDNGKVMRQGSIQAFYNDYGTKTNFSWGFLTFAGSSAQALINNGSAQSPTFSDSSDMQSAINSFSGTPDSGSTPYKAALTMAEDALNNDQASDPQTKYAIVFLSDGQPTDYHNGDSTELMQDVQDLIHLHHGQVTLSTVYYGPADAEASNRLKNMAKAGHGRFVDTNAQGRDFAIRDLVTLSNMICSE
jgi:Mg-chelatase subunit ChlD